MSGGGIPTDTESARLSNVQTYKFNSEKPPRNSIQKIPPNRQPIFEDQLPTIKQKESSPMTTL